MRKFKKNNREEYTSHHPSLNGIIFRKEGMDTNGNRISSTDNEAFGQYAGWRRHKKDGRFYGQDLYLNSGNAGDYYNDFVIPEGKIKRIVTECIANLKEEQDQEYAQNLVYIWVNNDRPLYDKKMQIVKMLAKKPSLDVNVLASSSMLAQFYRDIVNTARKSGDTISGDRKQLLMYLAQELLDEVAEYKNYECVSLKKKLVKEGYNESKTPRFVYMGEINSGEGEYELFEYAKEQGWLDEDTTEEDFDVLSLFEGSCSVVYVDGEDGAFFIDRGDVVFVYVTNYSDNNLVREMVEDFIRFERTADFMGHRDGSWHEADEEEVDNCDGVLYEFPSGLCRYYAR